MRDWTKNYHEAYEDGCIPFLSTKEIEMLSSDATLGFLTFSKKAEREFKIEEKRIIKEYKNSLEDAFEEDDICTFDELSCYARLVNLLAYQLLWERKQFEEFRNEINLRLRDTYNTIKYEAKEFYKKEITK